MVASIPTRHLIVACLCLLATAGLARWLDPPVGASVERRASLSEAFFRVDGWRPVRDQALDPEIRDALLLDDYLFRTFARDGRFVTVYIGYYESSKKVGAAHDPLVCFPGQGWTVQDHETGSVEVAAGGGRHRVRFATMVAEREGRRQLLLYWFQADDRAVPTTLEQKVALLASRARGGAGVNAFVRLSAPLGAGIAPEEARRTLLAFLEAFYPRLLEVVAGR